MERQRTSHEAYFALNTQRLVTWIAFLAVFAMAARVSIDTDTWWHLRAGEWIIENQSVPHTDLFSYTRFGAPWQYPGWPVEVLMALVHRKFGLGGLNLLTAVVVTTTFWFVWRTMTGGPFLRAFILVMAAAASGVYWAARPYIITFLLTAIFAYLLDRWRWDRSWLHERRLLFLPLLMVAWANSHGGFIVGFILLGIYGAAEAVSLILAGIQCRKLPDKHQARPFLYLVLISLLSVVAVGLNPSGPAMLLYPFKTLGISALSEHIQEWQSPNLQLPASQPFIWLILLLVGALGVSRRRLVLSDFLLVAGFLYLAFTAWRNVALFALVAPPVISRHLSPVIDSLARRIGYHPGTSTALQARLNWIILAAFGLAVFFRLFTVLPAEANLAEIRKTMPVDAVDFMKSAGLPGRLLNSYNWGGYLLWELPQYPVFIDGRTDLYDDSLVSEWLKIVRAEPGWQATLERWEVNLILVEPSLPITAELLSAGWQEVYRDGMAVIFAR